MRKILLFLMIISLVKIAQVNGQTFNNYYGSGTFSMNGNVGIPTEDGGYIVGGTSNPVTADWTKTDGMLMKLDALGNLVWSKRYNLNNYLDEFRKIIPITNHSSGVAGKGYLVIGTSYYDFPNDPRTTDIIVMKVDLSGNLVWTRSFTRSGETLWNGWDNGVDAFELADGSFAIGANFLGDLGCMRLNENGNFLNGTETNSTKIVNAAGPPPMSFGGSSSEGSNDAILNSSGRMVMIGKAELRNDTTGFYLLTWDIGGIGVTPSVTMGKMFDLSLGMKDFQAICEIPGGDYIISGFTETNALGGAGDRDGILMRITPAGNVIWAKKLGSNNREEFKSVSYDNVNNIVAVTGYTEQFGGVKKGVNLTLSLTGNIISKTSLNISSEQRDIQPIPSNQYLVTGTNNARAHVYTTSSSSLLTSCGSLDPIFNIQDLTITITDIDSRFSSPFTVSPTVNDYTGASAITPVDLTPSVVSTINIPTITIQPVAPAAICAGSGNVSFSVTAVGSSLTYQWRENGVNITNGGAYSGTTSTTLTITSPGSTFNGRTYDVVVTGVCGNSTSNSVTLTINPIPTVTITNPAAVCSPNTVDLTAASVTAGSTSGLTYTYFTDAAETNQITSAAASAIATSGTYYIKGTTTAGCSATQPVTVTINPTPTVVITNPPAVCSPNTVNITAASLTTGSTSGLIFTFFTDAAETNQITSAAASAIATSGTYYIKGSTTDGCSATQPVTATINPLPNFTVSKNDATTCDGTGSVTITINSPSGNYDVDLNGDGTFEYTNLAPTANTIQINNLAVGTVINDVQIRSLSTTCQNIFTINTAINAPGAPSNNTLSDAMCADGTTTRTLEGTPTGGVWTLATESTPGVGSISGTTFTVGSIAGSAIIRYTVSGCSSEITINVTSDPTVTITNPPAVCSPNTVNITASSVTTGSTSGLIFTFFTDAAETNQITSAAASAIATSGTYYIKGTTTAGCSVTQPVTVTINPTPTVVITNPPAVCSPNTVNINAASITTGSTSGLTYTYFTDAAETNQITSAAASAIATSGTYYIKGTTTAGCSVTQPVTATINPLPNFTVSKNDAATCGGTGSVTITINSPSGNYDVDLNGDGTFEYTNLAPTANTIQINNLAVGTVINDVQIRSLSTTCQNAFTINTSINAPGAPSNNTLSDAMCADGITARTLNGTPTGGVWTLATESTPGVGSISGTTFAVGSTAGTAIIRYTYAGCSSDISIVVNPIPSSPTVSNNGPICEGGNLNLAASNSTGTFNWTGPNGYTNTTQNPTINNATTAHSGTYSVTVSSNGCTSPAAVTQVTVNAIPSAPAVTISGPVCIGGNLSLTASGSETSYNWTGPNGFSSTEQNPVIPNINSTYEGTYNVTATSNGCNSSLGSANVTVNLPPAITNQPTSLPTICSGFSDLDFSVGATGTNLSYRWRENGSNILNGNSYQGATSPNLKIVRPSHTINGYAYVVVVSNLCGTITSNPVTVSIDAQSIGGSVSGEDKICEGSTSGLTLNGHNGALIMWEIAASPYTTWTQLANTSNSYTSEPLFTNTRFRAIVKNGVCPIANSAYKEVAVSKPENKAEAGNDQDICGANTASLAGNTPVAGIGTWTIIAGNGGSIESTQNPTSSFSGIIGEAYTLRWTLPNTTCPGSVDDVIIRFNQNLVAVVGSDMLNLCTTSVDLNASTPTYGNGRWEIIEGNGGAIQNPSTAASTFNGSAGNNYLLRWTVSSPNGCPSDAKDIRVSFDASPFANAGPDQTIKYGSTTHLQASGGVTYSWSSHSSISNTNIATPTVKPSSTTTYTVSVTNQHGCVGEDHVTILVEFPISIPNTFTPNGDGTNDHWEIANLETYPSAIITIYNRWGQLVATVDGGQFWDGKIKNQDAEIGTYFYILDLKNGTSPLNGSVSIVK